MTESTEGFRKDLEEFRRGAIDATALAERMGALLGFVEATQRKLQAKLFELRNLFDVSRELTSSLDDQTIADLTTATLMGHLMASRCAFFDRDGALGAQATCRCPIAGSRCRVVVTISTATKSSWQNGRRHSTHR